jgi:hypothetical protein
MAAARLEEYYILTKWRKEVKKALNFSVSHVPTKARIALWRDEPPSVTAPADLTIFLNLE